MDWDEILAVFTDVRKTSVLMALAFGITSLISSAIWIFAPRSHPSSVKLLGSLMVLALAFSSNHWGVYALAIFIIATLVTELDFLEKLAALFWNRDKYWEYRLGRATQDQKRERIAEEARKDLEAEVATLPQPEVESASPASADIPETQPADSFKSSSSTANSASARAGVDLQDRTTRLKDLVERGLEFEMRVKNALLRSTSPFVPPFSVLTDLSLKRPGRDRPLVIDAVVETTNYAFVIEIRNSRRPSAIHDTAKLLEVECAAYTDYLRQQGKSKSVMPVGIFPGGRFDPPVRDGMVLVGFDVASGTFHGTDLLPLSS